MRVFCLSTGRSGTTTFSRSLSHATNFTSGHETRTSICTSDRLEYPDAHIEADNRLAFFLGALKQRYDSANTIWVHLRRNPKDVVNSYLRRRYSPAQLVHAFGHGILMSAEPKTEDEWRSVTELMVRSVRANIEAFMETQDLTVTMDIENPVPALTRIWSLAGIEGDFAASIAEWEVRHNQSRRADPAPDEGTR